MEQNFNEIESFPFISCLFSMTEITGTKIFRKKCTKLTFEIDFIQRDCHAVPIQHFTQGQALVLYLWK